MGAKVGVDWEDVGGTLGLKWMMVSNGERFFLLVMNNFQNFAAMMGDEN